jgi:DNA-directed RNA polymerase specialized sigma24 family protein
VSWGLAQLRRSHAEVLEAFYFDGQSVREIAQDRSTSERAVEGRLRRARAKLKRKLQKVLSRGAARVAAVGERTSHVRQTPAP